MLPLSWGRPCWFERLPPRVYGFIVIVAMQIRARALLKQTDYVAMTVLGDLVGLMDFLPSLLIIFLSVS